MGKTINGEELKKLVNSNIASKIRNENYNIATIAAVNFINSFRIDILIKYLYAKSIIEKKAISFLKEMYLAHIKAFNGFVEADDTHKVGKESFLNNFSSLIESISRENLKENTFIPIGKNSIPMDGAHRISIASALNLPINVFTIDEIAPVYNLEFFRNRGLDSKFTDYTTIKYTEIKDNLYMVMIWPIAKGKLQEIENILNKNGIIINKKEIALSYNGLLNLQMVEYKEEKWLGNYSNDFEGAHTKCSQCYDKNGTLRAFLFESNADLISMKDDIRNIFNIGKHAIHINDTQEQTKEIAQLIFNDNALHFLNCRNRKEMKSFNQLFDEFTSYLDKNNINRDEVAIIGGVLSLYGIRDAKDLDYISINDKIPLKINNQIEAETKKINYTHYSAEEIITDPRLHFVYNGVKFVSLQVILEIKKKRNNDSDKRDIYLIEKLLKDGNLKFSLKEKMKIWTSISFYRRNIKLVLLKVRYLLYSLKEKL